MLYCERCGQCPLIDNTQFRQWEGYTSAEMRYLNPDTGEVEDYGDGGDMDFNGDPETECPNCSSNNVTTDWEGTEEEAKAQRRLYEIGREVEKVQRDKFWKDNEIKNSDWDTATN